LRTSALPFAASRRPGPSTATSWACNSPILIVSVPFGDYDVELLEPATPDGPIARFLARRGPGIHHLCYRVPDLPAALQRCRDLGYQLIDDAPRPGAGGRRVAFIHPKSTAGILIELTD
jgi:methylmalonyl-CoA epimerase